MGSGCVGRADSREGKGPGLPDTLRDSPAQLIPDSLTLSPPSRLPAVGWFRPGRIPGGLNGKGYHNA